MESNFITLELHKNTGEVLIKPAEITAISPAPEGGARVVTRQRQIYYVVETVRDVDSLIRLYFKKIKGEF
jgi:hypothetical protein